MKKETRERHITFLLLRHCSQACAKWHQCCISLGEALDFHSESSISQVFDFRQRETKAPCFHPSNTNVLLTAQPSRADLTSCSLRSTEANVWVLKFYANQIHSFNLLIIISTSCPVNIRGVVLRDGLLTCPSQKVSRPVDDYVEDT